MLWSSILFSWSNYSGDPFYELATVHAEIFHFDTDLLKQFLEGYRRFSSAYDREDFVYRAMVYFILYEFNHFHHHTKHKGLFKLFPEYVNFTWEQIAQSMWCLKERK